MKQFRPRYPSSWQIPNAEYLEFRPKATKYCIVIPVINEGQRIQTQLKKMHNLDLMNQCDTMVTDGGSTDGSLDIEYLEEINIRSLIIKKDGGKLGSQLRIAYAFALTDGYDGIVTIDGNNKDSVDSIPDFINALDQGFDYVQGSRYIDGGQAINTPILRHVGIRFIHAPLVSLAAGYWLTDTTNGFRAYSRSYLLSAEVQPFRNIFNTYEYLVYLAVRAYRIGLNVKEVPVTRAYPKKEPTPTKIRPLRGNLLMLKMLLYLLLGKYNP